MGGNDSDPTQGRKLTPEQQEEYQRAIEDYKAGEGRGGNDNLDNGTLKKILDGVLRK
jgi:hypothetical protein